MKTKLQTGNIGTVETLEDIVGSYAELSKDMDHVKTTVTASAAVSRGKNTSKNPDVRYKKLKFEAAPDLNIVDIKNKTIPQEEEKLKPQAGRPLEFAPVVLRYMVKDNEVILMNMSGVGVKRMSMKDFNNNVMRFSFIGDGNIIYTNMRVVVNNGIDEEKVVGDYPDYYKNFFIIKVKAPYFVFAQIRTHSGISQIAESARVLKHDEMYLPENALDKVKEILTEDYIEEEKLNCVGCDYCKYADRMLKAESISELVGVLLEIPVDKVKRILRKSGFKQEIYNRWPSFLEYKTWNMAGWLNDPKAWGHFLLEREAYPNLISSWVQYETHKIADLIREAIKEHVIKYQLDLHKD